MKQYLKYIKGNVFATIIAPILMIFDVLGSIVQPLLMSKIIDVGISNNDMNYIIKMGIIMAIFALVQMVSGFLCMYFSAKASYGFSYNLRKDLMKKIQEFSFYNINKYKTSSLITRVTNDVQVLTQLYQMTLRIVVRAPIMFFAGIIMCLILSKKLTLILVFLIPLLFIIILILMKKTAPLFLKVQKGIDNVNQVIKENLSGVRVIKSFVREDFERKRFNKANTKLRDVSVESYGKIVLMMPIINLILQIAIVLVLYFGSKEAINGNILVGSLSSLIMYIVRTLSAIVMMAMVFINFARAQVSSKRVLEVLNEKIDIKDNDSSYEITKGDIDFNVKKFIFKDTPSDIVLNNIKFSVKQGDVVAIIGSTGSGKSTIVNLLPRFYDVKEGYVKIDGIDVKKYNLEKLRDGIGMVLQENRLFKGTINENLKWGNSNATKEEIKKACEVAQIDDFIESLPDKYDSKVEQKGSNFSGGQKQRLCIARALLKNPKILILDDSVSALDATTEKKLSQALRKYYKNTTIFIITQRVSSCKNADYVLVMENGTINGIGSHKELLKNNKIYQEINESQKEVVLDA